MHVLAQGTGWKWGHWEGSHSTPQSLRVYSPGQPKDHQMSNRACLPLLFSPSLCLSLSLPLPPFLSVLSSPLSFLFLFLPSFLERTKFPRWSLGKNMWRKGSFHPVQFDVVLGGAAEGACDYQRGRGHVG